MTKSWACTKNSKLTRINCVYVQFKPILVHSVFIQFHVARCALARFNITNYTQARWVKCNDPFCQLHLKTVLALKMIAKIVVSFHLEFCSRAYMFLCLLTREREPIMQPTAKRIVYNIFLSVSLFRRWVQAFQFDRQFTVAKNKNKNKIIIIECRFINFTSI